jgi:hypothetical protein
MWKELSSFAVGCNNLKLIIMNIAVVSPKFTENSTIPRYCIK